MSSLGSLFVTLEAKSADFNKAVESAEDRLKNFSDAAEGLAVAAGAAFVGMAAAMGVAVKAAGEQEQAEVRLAAAARATGQAVDVSAMAAYAGELQKLTGISDDASLGVASVLTSFRLNEDQIKATLPLLQDLSAAFGVDMQGAAMALGRTLETGSNALGRMGVVLNDTEKDALENADAQGRLAIVLDKLRGSVGGTAEAMGGTALGSAQRLASAFGELAEALGGLVLGPVTDALGSMADAVNSVAEWVGGLSDGTKALLGWLGLAATAITGAAAGFLGLAAAAVKVHAIFAGLKALGLVEAIGGWSGALDGMKAAALGLLKALLPIVAIGGAIAGIAGSVSMLQTELTGTDQERQALRGRMGMTGQEGATDIPRLVGKALVESIKEGLDPLVEAFSDMGDVVEKTTASVSTMGQTFSPAASGGGGKAGPANFNFDTNGAAVALDGFILEVESATMDFADAGLAEQASQAIGDLGLTVRSSAASLGATMEETWRGAATNVEAFGIGLSEGLTQALGPLGGFVDTLIAGSSQGGLWGALGSLIASLLSKLGPFQDMLDQIVGILGDLLGRILGPLFTALQPLIDMVGMLADYIGTALLPVFNLLGAVMSLIVMIIGGIIWTVAKTVQGIAHGINEFLSWIGATEMDTSGLDESVAGLESKIEQAGENWMNLSHAAIDPTFDPSPDQPAEEAAAAAVSDQVVDLGDDIEDTGSAVQDFGDTMAEVNQELNNVPQGLKLAAARFEAITADASVQTSAPGAMAPMIFYIETVTTEAQSGQELAETLEGWARTRRLAEGGSSMPGRTAPFRGGGG